MNDTIELYRKLLEIEPASKAFYPLAGLLCETGRHQEAVDLLTRGLANHAEHLEARLLLVEALRQAGDRQAAAAEAGRVSQVLARFPGFWQAWAEDAAGRTPDAGLALAFVAAWLRGRNLSWADLIREAMARLLEVSPPAGAEVPTPVVPPAPAAASSEALDEPLGEPQGDALDEALLPNALDDALDDVQTASQGAPRFDPLRTRTMADVLADQGDLASAVDIYADLAAQALQSGDIARHAALDARLEELRQAQDAAGHRPDQEQRTDRLAAGEAPRYSTEADPLRHRLIGRLERLAQRLERRAGA